MWALIQAADENDLKKVLKLLRKNGGQCESYAVHRAICKRHTDIVFAFVDYAGHEELYDILLYAIEVGSIQIVAKILERIERIHSWDNYHAFCKAVMMCKMDIAKYLYMHSDRKDLMAAMAVQKMGLFPHFSDFLKEMEAEETRILIQAQVSDVNLSRPRRM